MRIIKIEPLSNGAFLNQSGNIKNIPEGWAMIPDDMETPNFPFGAVEVEEIDGVMTVTKWEAGEIPEPEPMPEPEPTAEELINIILGVE
jgi:hypothetical protein